MSTVAQIDRSDLEKMEKDRLLAIGKELQLKVSTRNRKADIIEMIMSAALPSSDVENVSIVEQSKASDVQTSSRGRTSDKRRKASEGVENADLEDTHGESTNGGSVALRDPSRNGSKASISTQSLFPPITVVPKTKSNDAPSTLGKSPSPKDASGDEIVIKEATSTGAPKKPESGVQSELPTVSSTPEPVSSSLSRTDGESGSRRSRRRRGRDSNRGQERGESTQTEISVPVELSDISGILDLRDEGFGFIRANGYLPSPKDIYVSAAIVRRYGLRKGDFLVGGARPANANEKYSAVVRVDQVSGSDPEESKGRPLFNHPLGSFNRQLSNDRMFLSRSIKR